MDYCPSHGRHGQPECDKTSELLPLLRLPTCGVGGSRLSPLETFLCGI